MHQYHLLKGLNNYMGRAIYKCAKCGVRQYEAELIYDSTVKDFVCRKTEICQNPSYSTKSKRRKVLAK